MDFIPYSKSLLKKKKVELTRAKYRACQSGLEMSPQVDTEQWSLSTVIQPTVYRLRCRVLQSMSDGRTVSLNIDKVYFFF